MDVAGTIMRARVMGIQPGSCCFAAEALEVGHWYLPCLVVGCENDDEPHPLTGMGLDRSSWGYGLCLNSELMKRSQSCCGDKRERFGRRSFWASPIVEILAA